MSKHNGNGKEIEKHHFDKPDAIPFKDGISIIANGEGKTPSEVRVVVKVPRCQVRPMHNFQQARAAHRHY